jgi:uncharacterized delta-60 repeat protein
MSAKTKFSGTWRNITIPYIKVNGAWKAAKSSWIKVGSVWKNWFLQGGLNDELFNSQNVFSGFESPFYKTIRSIAIQPSDNSFILAGNFRIFNGTSIPDSIVKFNQDGTLNTEFNTNLGLGFEGTNRTISSVKIQSNGQILVGGNFSTLNGSPVSPGIVRLNSNGTLDTAFNTNVGTGGQNINFIQIQSNGQILVGGVFTTFNGTTRNRLIRLNSNGTLDTTFSTNMGTAFNGSVLSLAIQSNGQILVAGQYTAFNGVTSNNFVRLNSNGTLDTTFNNNLGTGFNANTSTVQVQSNGQILVGGGFTTFNGTTRNRLVRLNSDGTLDTTFSTNMGTAFNGNVSKILVRSSGEIIVGGTFTTFNGVASISIVLLNSSGLRVSSFSDKISGGLLQLTNQARELQDIQINPNNQKIFIGGLFNRVNNQTTKTNILILNEDGEQDNSIFPEEQSFSGVVRFITSYSNEKTIVSGDFGSFGPAAARSLIVFNKDMSVDSDFMNSFNSVYTFSTPIIKVEVQADQKIIFTNTQHIIRLNLDLTLDSSFNSNLTRFSWASGFFQQQPDGSFVFINIFFPSTMSASALQSDQKIIFSGRFDRYDQASIIPNNLARTNSDGTLDTTFRDNIGTGFESGFTGRALAIEVQSNGQILLGGSFTTFNGTTRNRLIRLNSNGTLDTTFSTNLGTAFNADVNSLAIQSNGQILVGGSFTTFNGTTRNRLVRLNSDGTLDTTFSTNMGTAFNGQVLSLAIQSNGQILVGGGFTTFNGTTRNRLVRLNSDGTLDTAFSSNLGDGFSDAVLAIGKELDGKVLVGGQFFKFNNKVFCSFN